MARPPACPGMGRVGRAIAAAALFITYPSSAAVVRDRSHAKEQSSVKHVVPNASDGQKHWHPLQPLASSASALGSSTEWTSQWWLDVASPSVSQVLPRLGSTAFLALAKPDPVVVSAPPDAGDNAQAALRALRALVFIITLAVSCIFAMVVAFVAHMYKTHNVLPKVPKYESHEDFADFKTGLFDCWEDLPLCCFVFQCPWISWADNISSVSTENEEPRTVPILNFWVAMFTILMLFVLSNLGGLMVMIVMACFMAYFRQKFRKAFKMTNNTGSCIQDVILYLCCGYCLIAQDARHVEEAKIQAHPAIAKSSS